MFWYIAFVVHKIPVFILYYKILYNIILPLLHKHYKMLLLHCWLLYFQFVFTFNYSRMHTHPVVVALTVNHSNVYWHF